MNTWAPLFSKIVRSSLWSETDCVVKIFLTLLAVKDADHIARFTAYEIGDMAKKTERETLDALAVLASPDTLRIEPQPYEGRRVEKVEGVGWRILNGQFYENLMREANNRVRKTQWESAKRAKQKSGIESWRPKRHRPSEDERGVSPGDVKKSIESKDGQPIK